MWLTFILYGIILTLIIFVFQRNKLNFYLRITLIVILFLLLLLCIYLNSVIFLSNNIWYNKSPSTELIFFFMMLLGMFARYISKAIEDRNVTINKLRISGEKFEKPKLELDIWEMAYPLFFSIITFGMLLRYISTEQVELTELVLSFQTGFFWQTILNKQIL